MRSADNQDCVLNSLDLLNLILVVLMFGISETFNIIRMKLGAHMHMYTLHTDAIRHCKRVKGPFTPRTIIKITINYNSVTLSVTLNAKLNNNK